MTSKYMFVLLISGLAFISLWESIDGYKILIVSPFPARSHHNVGKGIADTLHTRGHEITFVNCYDSEKPLYREIVIPELHALKDEGFFNFNSSKESGVLRALSMNQFINSFVEMALENHLVKKLINDKEERFDLVMVEYFINEPFYGFAVRFDCPLIVFTPTSFLTWLARDTGNPTSPESIPNLFLGNPKEMGLFERTINFVITGVMEAAGSFIIKPSQAKIYEKYFPNEAAKVDFYDLHKRISLVFTNTHPSFENARPLLPNVIEIGGYHIGEIKPLTDEYKKILDNAKNGVIFFSMGSNLKSSELDEDVKQSILKSLGRLKETVLWKFETDLPGKPNNVIIKKWMPQSSILRHPNVKLFITHGGLMSSIEAASAGVPLLSIPIFGDQKHNAESAENRGVGLKLDYFNITETSLTWALKEILGNPIYTEAARKAAKLFNDRPMRPRDLISFYVEHVVRTGGAQHLSGPKLDLISSTLLDVIAVLTIPPLVMLMLTLWLCRKCCRRSSKSHSKKQKTQ